MADQPETRITPPDETRGLGHDVIVAVAAGAAGGAVGPVVAKVTDVITNRPATEPAPEIVLPPGVDADE